MGHSFNLKIVETYGLMNLNFLFSGEYHFRSLLRILVLSFLSLTIAKREVSSAKSFALDFNSFGQSLM